MRPSWAQTAKAADASTTRHRILVVGDSLSAEYGLRRGAGWVALLQQRLAKEGVSADVRNASISGDTTSGGRARLAPLLRSYQPTHMVLELGGNDALRGLPLKSTADNLRAMTQAAQDAGAQVLIVGMQVPPNYGGDYGRQFSSLFAEVAAERKAGLVPFLLKGVADGPDAASLFQADRIHPREEAQAAMLDNVWPALRRQLR
ncbi:arylesterase [Pseudorhodoferax sp. Leaf267]|uniref:arylesterase n=1 Tax=Pseudorhodoferax sp. Leaf267 TaxID=1736316 RepID=UPI0006FE6EBF|nr:arylesterase [Pseudorhodoferax sp. Leaf267]KQP23550.1 arylesterase [Pseudorhodoferax sp. Leaf267]